MMLRRLARLRADQDVSAIGSETTGLIDQGRNVLRYFLFLVIVGELVRGALAFEVLIFYCADQLLKRPVVEDGLNLRRCQTTNHRRVILAGPRTAWRFTSRI